MKRPWPKLSELMGPLGIGVRENQADPRIASVHYRAQDVTPDGVFVAIPGLRHDGAAFIDQAVINGAAAIVVQAKAKKREAIKGVLVIEVPDARYALAGMASQFYGRPSEKLVVIGITGTNGKTTTTYLIENILAAAGFSTGLIGTIDYRFGGQSFKNPVTTPESADLQSILADMLAAGVTHVVMEVSSHAIDLDRIAFCFMDLAVFTNLSQDHLDYHKDMQQYWACKKRLFTEHLLTGPKKALAKAVVNMADARGRDLVDEMEIPTVSVNVNEPATVWSPHITARLGGIAAEIHTPEGDFEIKSPLLGAFNGENILCATGAGWALGVEATHLKTGVETLAGVSGRLEPVSTSNGKHVFVDYAHTPDALANVLAAARALSEGRLVCIFGCGGDRDQAKRSQMGAIAAKGADIVVVTSDNPRSEDPLSIINQIVEGISQTGMAPVGPEGTSGGYLIEPDRRSAIAAGIKAANKKDIVVIAGKGHEDYQIIGDSRIDFDDRQVALNILEGGL